MHRVKGVSAVPWQLRLCIVTSQLSAQRTPQTRRSIAGFPPHSNNDVIGSSMGSIKSQQQQQHEAPPKLFDPNETSAETFHALNSTTPLLLPVPTTSHAKPRSPTPRPSPQHSPKTSPLLVRSLNKLRRQNAVASSNRSPSSTPRNLSPQNTP